MVFPELLRRVLARDALQDLSSARVLVDESWSAVSAPLLGGFGS